MADMSKISPDSGATVYNLKDANARANKWDKSSQKVAGAYNLLENTLITKTIGSTLALTVNADKTITVSGSFSGSSAHWEKIGEYTPDSNERLKLTGCPTGGSFQGFSLYVEGTGGGGSTYDYGDGQDFNLTAGIKYVVFFRIVPGTPAFTTPITLKPMLTPDLNAAYADYTPYVISNRDILKRCITEILSIQTVESVTIPKNNNYVTKNVDIGKSGYTPLGVTTVMPAHATTNMGSGYAYALNGNTVSIIMYTGDRQPASADITDNVVIIAIYRNN